MPPLLPRFMSLLGKLRRTSPRDVLKEAGRVVRTRTRFEPRFLRGRALGVYSVSFWLTRRCNLKCDMCWVERSARAEGEEYLRSTNELTLDELRKVVDDVRRYRPRIGITGGEPFVRPDAVDFIAYVMSSGLRCGVNTNGMFLSRDAAELVGAGLDNVMVSLDGPADVHDRIRGVAGSWGRAYEGLRVLLDARVNAGTRKRYVKVTTTITDDNCDRIADTAELLSKLPLDELTFQHVWFTTPSIAAAQRHQFKNLFGQDTTYLQGFVYYPSGIDLDKLEDEMQAIEQTEYQFPVNFYPRLSPGELRAYYLEPARPLRSRCFSRWLRVDIMPDGTVTPCLGLEVGNVREKPFGEIWNGELFQ
ncbi:MAG: radical SAM protein, partial [Candidatus Coatesbacteria bacterium]